MPKLRRALRLACAGIFAGGFAGTAVAGYVTFGNGFGSKWDNPVFGTPAVITWGFMPNGTTVDPGAPIAPEVVGGSNVTALRSAIDAQYGAGAFDAALLRAFHTWSLVAGVTFVGPVADPGLPEGSSGATTPDIRIGAFAAVPGSGFSFVGAVGYGPPGDDLDFPDPVAGDLLFDLSSQFAIHPGNEGDPFPNDPVYKNDLEGLFLHELGHAAMGLGHPSAGPAEVMYVGAGCCVHINRVPSPDDITGARLVYGFSSTPACQNGIDDDGDGKVDFPADPDCTSAADPSESPACSDGLDNDGDGLIDYPADPGCFNAASTTESPACQDGIDNDGDGGIDFDGGAAANHGVALGPPDPNCNKPFRTDEKPNPSCGLGAELALAAPLLAWLRGRRRPASAPPPFPPWPEAPEAEIASG